MRHFLISALLLSLVAGCSSVSIGPHRIDVQQGNALDQENVSRLKPGLNRSQVRFLLGTPLLVDPFRNDRWDYVYVYYKAGRLAEQKRITLFFEGDTLARIEGDLPAAAPAVPEPAVQPEPKAAIPAAVPPVAASQPAAAAPVVQAEPAKAMPAHAPEPRAPVASAPVVARPPAAATPAEAAPAAVVAAPVATAPAVAAATPHAARPETASPPATSIVAPLPSPKNAPPYVDPRPASGLSLQTATDVASLKPDVFPSMAEPAPAVSSDDPVLKSVQAWAAAWSRRDPAAYFAAYDASFVPPGNAGRADWERRKREAMRTAKSIEVKVDSPSIERSEEGTATVTFKQFYQAGRYRDAVLKQLLMVENQGRWLIVEETVLSTLPDAQP